MEEKKKFKLVTSKKTRYLLPNILTLAGVCLGISSIKFSIDGNYSLAVIFILLAAILDALDGRIARLIKGTSEFGKELDSLTDFVSFGIAPVFILYFWELNNYGKLGWAITLIFSVCCVLRLARFNLTKISENESWKINFFEGIPSPAAAGLVLLPLILSLSNIVEILNLNEVIKMFNLVYIFQIGNNSIFCSIIILITSILMVSKVPTYSLKRIAIPRSLGAFLLLGIGVYISVLIFFTFEVLFLTGLIYIFLIPVSYFHHKYLDRKFLKERVLQGEHLEEDEIEDIL